MRYWELKGWFSFACWYCAFFRFCWLDKICGTYACNLFVWVFLQYSVFLFILIGWTTMKPWQDDIICVGNCFPRFIFEASYDIVESSWNLRPTFFKLVNGNLSKFLHSKTALITFNSLLRFRCELIPRIYLCSWRLKTFFVEHVRKLHIHRESRKLERWKVFL